MTAANRAAATLLVAVLAQVATYVIETDVRKYSLQSLVGLGSDELDSHVTVGGPVTFAIEKKTAYIKIDEREYRLLVTSDEKKTVPPQAREATP